MPQSRRRKVVFFSPRPLPASSSATLSTAAFWFRPSSTPEFTQTPRCLSPYQSAQAAVEKVSPSTATTCWIGSWYFSANAKSRSSCAGTPITAPSP
jgi:hypothetical protein